MSRGRLVADISTNPGQSEKKTVTDSKDSADTREPFFRLSATTLEWLIDYQLITNWLGIIEFSESSGKFRILENSDFQRILNYRSIVNFWVSWISGLLNFKNSEFRSFQKFRIFRKFRILKKSKFREFWIFSEELFENSESPNFVKNSKPFENSKSS